MPLVNSRRAHLALLLIVILGFSLRLHNLGGGSLWTDELIATGRIGMPLVQMVKSLFRYNQPPLYYLIMNCWVRIFGNSEFWLRFPSLICSVLSIIFIFRLAKELFNEKVGLFSAFLLSLSPYSINYAQEVKMYAMFWSMGILSFLFFYRFTKDNRQNSLLAYIFWTAISIYTSYLSFFFVVVQNVLFFSFFRVKRLKKWLLGQLIILLLYLPWMPIFLYSVTHRVGIVSIPETDNYFYFLIKLFKYTTGIQVGGWSPLSYIVEFTLYGVLIISAFINYGTNGKKKPIFSVTRNDILIFAWIAIPVIIFLLIDALAFPILVVRYMGFIHIPLIILFSKGLNNLRVKARFTVIFLMLVMIFSYHLYPLYEMGTKFYCENWRHLFRLVHRKVGDDALIVSKLEPWVLEYYNKGYKIRSLSCLEDRTIGDYSSVVILYRDESPAINPPSGYALVESYRLGNIGFLWFKFGGSPETDSVIGE